MIDPQTEQSGSKSRWGRDPVPLSDRPRKTIADDAQPKPYGSENPHAAATTLIHGIREMVGKTQANEVGGKDGFAFVNRNEFDPAKYYEALKIDYDQAKKMLDNAVLAVVSETKVENQTSKTSDANFSLLFNIMAAFNKLEKFIIPQLISIPITIRFYDTKVDPSLTNLTASIDYIPQHHGVRITYPNEMGNGKVSLTERFLEYFEQQRSINDITIFLVAIIDEVKQEIINWRKAKTA